MMLSGRSAAVALLCAIFSVGPAGAREATKFAEHSGGRVHVTDLVVVPVPPGYTKLPKFTPDGRTGGINRVRRSVGTAGDSDMIVISVQSVVDPRQQVFVQREPSENGKPMPDFLWDAPYTGENYLTSVRLAKARIEGEKTWILVVAARDWEPTMAGPTLVTFRFYQLVSGEDGDPMTKESVFRKILERRSEKTYSHSDVALWEEFGWPVPKDCECVGGRY
jgi:hypothetical protein